MPTDMLPTGSKALRVLLVKGDESRLSFALSSALDQARNKIILPVRKALIEQGIIDSKTAESRQWLNPILNALEHFQREKTKQALGERSDAESAKAKCVTLLDYFMKENAVDDAEQNYPKSRQALRNVFQQLLSENEPLAQFVMDRVEEKLDIVLRTSHEMEAYREVLNQKMGRTLSARLA